MVWANHYFLRRIHSIAIREAIQEMDRLNSPPIILPTIRPTTSLPPCPFNPCWVSNDIFYVYRICTY